MAVNKVQFGGNTLIDLTSDTVSAADVLSGKRFHLPNGEQSVGVMVAPKCKIFTFTSATAVANQDVTVVSGDSDVAAHYTDADAMVVVRKVTNNAVRGTVMIVGTNHAFGVSTSMYMNYNGTSNGANVKDVPLTATSPSGVCVRCNANGDIIVHCLSTQNNFGGASYIIVFTW